MTHQPSCSLQCTIARWRPGGRNRAIPAQTKRPDAWSGLFMFPCRRQRATARSLLHACWLFPGRSFAPPRLLTLSLARPFQRPFTGWRNDFALLVLLALPRRERARPNGCSARLEKDYLSSAAFSAASWSTLARGGLPSSSSLACWTHSSRSMRPPRDSLAS